MKREQKIAIQLNKEYLDMLMSERNHRQGGQTVSEWAKGVRAGYGHAVRDLCARVGVQFNAYLD